MVDNNTNHRGQGWYFLPKFDISLGRTQNVDDIHDTFVARVHEDVIDWRRHQVKGMMKRKVIGTTVTTQTRTQAGCLR